MVGLFTLAYLEPHGGADSRVDPSATAYPHRDAAYSFQIQTGWTEPGQDGAVRERTTASPRRTAPITPACRAQEQVGPGQLVPGELQHPPEGVAAPAC
jgi:hypothetical protein